MVQRLWFIAFLAGKALAISGCIPVPVSTVSLHPREDRPFAVETVPAASHGTFSCPVYNSDATLLAVFNSGSNLVEVLRSSDLSTVKNIKPKRRPRHLSFSSNDQFLVVVTHSDWIDDVLKNRPAPAPHVDIDSPEAIKDDIQKAEIWDLQTGEAVAEIRCDTVQTSQPEGGWLWARRWAISPGYRRSALLEAHFSADDKEFSVLCQDGVQQRWDSHTWNRLEDIPAPRLWNALMGFSTAKWLAPSNRLNDGRIALLQIRENTLYLWNQNKSQTISLSGGCTSRLMPPVYAFSRDGGRIVVVCDKDLGDAVRVWDLGSGKELPLENAEFGFSGGIPSLRGESVVLSPDGRYLAVALLGQMEALLPNVLLVPATLSRSDLRLWDVDLGRELISMPIDELDAGQSQFRGSLLGVDLTFSPDGKTLAVAGRRLRLYRIKDLETGPR